MVAADRGSRRWPPPPPRPDRGQRFHPRPVGGLPGRGPGPV